MIGKKTKTLLGMQEEPEDVKTPKADSSKTPKPASAETPNKTPKSSTTESNKIPRPSTAEANKTSRQPDSNKTPKPPDAAGKTPTKAKSEKKGPAPPPPAAATPKSKAEPVAAVRSESVVDSSGIKPSAAEAEARVPPIKQLEFGGGEEMTTAGTGLKKPALLVVDLDDDDDDMRFSPEKEQVVHDFIHSIILVRD